MLIEMMYQNPGLTIFFVLWIFGILDYVLRKDGTLLDLAMAYSFLYGIFKIIMWILT